MAAHIKTRMSKDGDMVDLIAYEEYGNEAGRSAIHKANPALADHGLVLPAGIVIVIPEFEQPKQPAVHGGVTAR
ncbi:tail protein X [Polycladidibacter stylochi]|uniref:tail protein X n=1 Tax=Polycladidibacter stylochi TaxID=1807766 RepID=UPI000AF3B35E|nr:tail protein X [Pseudovibrio stylochi]